MTSKASESRSTADHRAWFEDLPERLAAALGSVDGRSWEPAGDPALWPNRGGNAAPGLAYGRHRGPAPAAARRAAVAIVWMPGAAGHWQLPLTLRPQSLRHHGGQVCLPGGRIESGETPEQAALREFTEELGDSPTGTVCHGRLPDQYIYASNNLVTPILFTAGAAPRPWRPNPVEVAEVIELPLGELLEARISPIPSRWRSVQRGGQTVGRFCCPSPAYQVRGRLIWGATAILLAQVASLLRRG